MPYQLKKTKNGKYRVVNRITGKHYSKKPQTKEMARKQLAALEIHAPDKYSFFLKFIETYDRNPCGDGGSSKGFQPGNTCAKGAGGVTAKSGGKAKTSSAGSASGKPGGKDYASVAKSKGYGYKRDEDPDTGLVTHQITKDGKTVHLSNSKMAEWAGSGEKEIPESTEKNAPRKNKGGTTAFPGSIPVRRVGENKKKGDPNDNPPKIVDMNGKEIETHIPVGWVSPKWTDVHISTDPESNLQVMGRDEKGRPVRHYKPSFVMKNAIAKFAKVRELILNRDEIIDQNQHNRRDPKHKENADCLWLIQEQAMRPGSDKDTKAEKKAYGATNMREEHVFPVGGKVYIIFTGKKGVDHYHEIKNPEVAKMLLERKKTAGSRGGRIFDTDSDKLLEYTKSLGKGGFTPKNFRTMWATRHAAELVKAHGDCCKSKKEYIKLVNSISTKVSQTLGNNPSESKNSYIDPFVWGGLSQGEGGENEKPVKKKSGGKVEKMSIEDRYHFMIGYLEAYNEDPCGDGGGQQGFHQGNTCAGEGSGNDFSHLMRYMNDSDARTMNEKNEYGDTMISSLNNNWNNISNIDNIDDLNNAQLGKDFRGFNEYEILDAIRALRNAKSIYNDTSKDENDKYNEFKQKSDYEIMDTTIENESELERKSTPRMKRAMSRWKSLGIRASYNGYEEWKRKNPNEAEQGIGPIAFYVSHKGAIYINTKSKYWNDNGEKARELYQRKWLSSSHRDQAVWHEEAHAIHDKNVDFATLDKMHSDEDIRGIGEQYVSGYSSTNAKEFVAEVYAGIMSGQKYNNTVMNLYQKLKGPEPRLGQRKRKSQ